MVPSLLLGKWNCKNTMVEWIIQCRKNYTLRQKLFWIVLRLRLLLKGSRKFLVFRNMKLLDRHETVADVGFKESSLLFEGGGIFVRRLGVMAGWRIGLGAKKTRPWAGIGWAPDPWVSNSPRKLDSWPSLLGAFKDRQEMQKFYTKSVLAFVTSYPGPKY